MNIEYTERMHRILGVIHHLSIDVPYRKWNRFGKVCEAIIELCIDIDSDKFNEVLFNISKLDINDNSNEKNNESE